MSEQDATDLLAASDGGLITREKFSSLKMWIDDIEVSQDRNYSIPFERLRMIKELLFDVNCAMVDGKDEPLLNVGDLIEVLREPAK